MKIKNIEVGNLLLAPMADVTDVGFRKVCKMCGADLTYTEMVSSKALLFKNEKTLELLKTSELETVKAVQIFGHVPFEMAEVCKMKELEKFDIIDINFGCPAPKIVKNNDGSAILKDLNLMGKIVYECTKSTNKPITAKTRIGFALNENLLKDILRVLEDNGASCVTIHGRTREQGYSGEIDYNAIAFAKTMAHIPVVGNGNVFNLKSYQKLKDTGVDAVMIGRGALGNPFIFEMIKDYQAGIIDINGNVLSTQNFNQNNIYDKSIKNKELSSLIQIHCETLKQFYSEKYLSAYMKKHFLWYLKEIPNAQEAKKQICESSNFNEMAKITIETICKNA